ncbi:hypothetical protein SDC9_184580 [bioreactor metagenome]|uniref:Uncharacterized protein n=1 Tax=bioreactor metagenome TaxID=1076179 RepID=A0A645HLU1_9ZZZZ
MDADVQPLFAGEARRRGVCAEAGKRRIDGSMRKCAVPDGTQNRACAERERQRVVCNTQTKGGNRSIPLRSTKRGKQVPAARRRNGHPRVEHALVYAPGTGERAVQRQAVWLVGWEMNRGLQRLQCGVVLRRGGKRLVYKLQQQGFVERIERFLLAGGGDRSFVHRDDEILFRPD